MSPPSTILLAAALLACAAALLVGWCLCSHLSTSTIVLADTSTKQQAFAACLRDAQIVLDREGQEFFLVAGTLLGCIREQQFIEHDDDIDIGIFRDKFRPSAMTALADSPNFTLVGHLGQLDTGKEYKFRHSSGIAFDVFLYYPESPAGMYYSASFFGMCDQQPGRICKWKRPIRGLKKVPFANSQYLVPDNAEEHLEWHYGLDWQTPKKFNYWEGLDGGYKNLVTSPPLSNFRVVYINLDHRTDRRRWMEQQLQSWPGVQRLAAVNGTQLQLPSLVPDTVHPSVAHEVDAPPHVKTFGITLTRGALGCALSHLQAWQQVQDQPLLVLEDDIAIQCTPEDVQAYLARAPADWDLLYLGSGQYIKGPEVSPGLFRVRHAYQTIGYLVRPSSVHKLMRVFPLTMQVDSALNQLGLHAYIVEPPMVEPRRDMGTDIQIRD